MSDTQETSGDRVAQIFEDWAKAAQEIENGEWELTHEPNPREDTDETKR